MHCKKAARRVTLVGVILATAASLLMTTPASAQEMLEPFDENVVTLEFPHQESPRWLEAVEAVPTMLTWPVEPMAKVFERILHLEHHSTTTELDDEPKGLQPIPDRPPLIFELNELFLGKGSLKPGIETHHGAVWRPALWVFGQFRTAVQYFDRGAEPTVDWDNRLDLFAQLNLSGTERVLAGLRPLDEEVGGGRNFSGYDMKNGDGLDGWNGKLQTLFFEGDIGEIFPRLDPFDVKALDLGFSVGRMPLLAQQGLLINEDMIDAVTVTRNNLYGHGNINLRATGVYSWSGINRNSVVGRSNDYDPSSEMIAILTESDYFKRTINLDAAYVYGDPVFGEVFTVAASSIRRFHGFENTYNSSLHVLASFPDGPTTDYADQGELIFSQLSWTPHHTEDLVYLNTFWAIDQFTSPARGPLLGGPRGLAGILFAGVNLGRYSAPINVTTDNVVGADLGYQWFFGATREQLIWEVGGVMDTDGNERDTIGTAMRFQKAFGHHTVLVVDGFVTKREGQPVAQGARTELLIKF